MTTVEAADDASEGPASRSGTSEHAVAGHLPVILLIALYIVAVIVYVLLGRGAPIPQVSPDEFIYSSLARSVADGQGLAWNGASQNLKAALWIYMMAPAWMVTSSTVTAYAVAKVIAALVSCTVVFPTWLLARRYVPPMVALVPAALAVGGSWMAQTGQMLTENAAYALAGFALAALVVAVAKPGSRWGWVALLFAALATWSRLQMGVLVPVIFIALAIDIAACGGGWRQRLRANVWIFALTGVVTFAALVVAFGSPSSLGFYGDVVKDSSLSDVPGFVGKQLVAFIVMTGILPFIVLVATSARRDVWRAHAQRALLVVCWTAIAVFILQTAYSLPQLKGVTWAIQRYVEYPLPLVFVAMVVALWKGEIDLPRLAGATVAVAAALLFTPDVKNIQEERGVFGFSRLADNLLGSSPGVALAIFAVLAGGALALVIRSRGAGTGGWALVGVSLAAVVIAFGIQDERTWHWQREQAQAGRAALAADARWIDHAAKAPVARLVGIYSNPAYVEQTEFFNKNIKASFVPAGTQIGGKEVRGRVCKWTVNPTTGAVTFAPGCGGTPTRFYLGDDLLQPTFYDQRVLDETKNGRVVAVNPPPPGQPRLKATIQVPCTDAFKTQNPRTGGLIPAASLCLGQQNAVTSGQLWLDKPGKVVVRFKGGAGDAQVQFATSVAPSPKITDLPAGKPTEITFALPKGPQQFQGTFGWPGGRSNPANPVLESVTLVQDGKSERLTF